MRYILTVVILVGAFGTALYMRGERARPAAPETSDSMVVDPNLRPEVRTTPVDGGTAVQLHLLFAGSCSRASLVYLHKGEQKVLDATTNCRRSIERAGLEQDGSQRGDGYVSEIELGGTLPDGASDVQIVLESETGTRIAPVKL